MLAHGGAAIVRAPSQRGYTWRMLVSQRLSLRQMTTSCTARLGGIGPIEDETEESAANSDEWPNPAPFEAELAIVGPPGTTE